MPNTIRPIPIEKNILYNIAYAIFPLASNNDDFNSYETKE
jgi:hypothetical protein